MCAVKEVCAGCGKHKVPWEFYIKCRRSLAKCGFDWALPVAWSMQRWKLLKLISMPSALSCGGGKSGATGKVEATEGSDQEEFDAFSGKNSTWLGSMVIIGNPSQPRGA